MSNTAGKKMVERFLASIIAPDVDSGPVMEKKRKVDDRVDQTISVYDEISSPTKNL